MQKIPITLTAPGMKLAKPVTNEGGMTIVAEGIELTGNLISRLKSMKIDCVTVHGHPVDMGGKVAGTRFAERVKRLDHLFRRYDKDKWMVQVKKRIGQYFQIKAAAQEAQLKAMEESGLEANGMDTVENAGGEE